MRIRWRDQVGQVCHACVCVFFECGEFDRDDFDEDDDEYIIARYADQANSMAVQQYPMLN